MKKTDDGLPTAYPYLAKLAKGSLLDELGQKIPAALSYQEVMQNLEGTLDAEHPFIQKAFSQWMWARNEIERAGELEEAEQAGLCKCWPYEEYLNQPVPAIRIPPIMPKRAQRSGHVIVKYDVDETGVPYNISEVSSSSKVFTKSALRSVEAWRHLDVTEETHLDFDPESRKNLTTTIFFRLSDQNGKLIPE